MRKKFGKILAAAMTVVTLAASFVGGTAFAAEEKPEQVTSFAELAPGEYKVDAELGCYIPAMGGMDFGVGMVEGATITVGFDGSAKCTLELTAATSNIYGIKCVAFVDTRNSAPVYLSGSEWKKAEFELSDKTATDPKRAEVNYADKLTFELDKKEAVYQLGLYVNSNVMGIQFGGENPYECSPTYNNYKAKAELSVNWDKGVTTLKKYTITSADDAITDKVVASLKKSSDSELIKLVEKACAEGKAVKADVVTKAMDIEKLSDEVKAEYEKAAAVYLGDNLNFGQIFDIDFGLYAESEIIGNLTELTDKIKVSVKVDEEVVKDGRTYKMYRVHNNSVDVLDVTVAKAEDGSCYAEFETDRFSTYVLAYSEAPKNEAPKNEEPKNEGAEAPKTGDALSIIFWAGILVSASALFGFTLAGNKEH